MSQSEPPPFLLDLLGARSPSGFEGEAQAVVDRHVGPVADDYRKDPLGNRLATINQGKRPRMLLAGHMDELGLIIRHIDTNGFLYFDALGGHDRMMIPGRRVTVLAANGDVRGVTGKRAIHLMNEEDRKKIPQLHEMWIDIGAGSEKEARERVGIGDPAVYTHDFEILHGTVGIARAFDNKSGCYVVNETLRRLAAERSGLTAEVTAVSTVQEEIGTRGAMTSSFSIAPDIGIAVDVGHSTDHPDCDHRKHGSYKLGGGPIVGRGPNINPFVYKRLIECAESNGIPYQVIAEPRPTPTDARAIQVAGPGAAAGLVSIPLRYMHTPSEIVDLEDLESCVRLLVAFARSLEEGDRGLW